MGKKIAMLGVVVLCIAGLVFLSGCDKETAAAGQENTSVCQKEMQAVCSKTLDSSQKGSCGLKTDKACSPDSKMACCTAKQKAGTCEMKTDKACPPDCKMAFCAAKQKAGTCPSTSNKSSCPKVCPEKSKAL